MPSRRRFLLATGRSAAALTMMPLAACSRRQETEREATLPAPAPRVTPPSALVAQLEREIPSLLEVCRLPGLSIALVGDGQVVWSRGFGFADNASKAPVDADTLFECGSVSKTVFAYAVMKLCEAGLLALDTPLVNYIAERWIEDDPRFDRITARHVLSHTSGLPNWRSQEEPMRLAFAPGARWQYSGEGYNYLQLVVAHRTGHVSETECAAVDGVRVCATGIDSWLRAMLLRPFGMVSSGYVLEPSAVPRMARAHDESGAPIRRPHPTPLTAARYGAAGGLVTSPVEYARFLIEVIDPKPEDTYRLSRAGRDEMIRPHVTVDERSSWALGWRVLHWKGGDVISHGGDNPGFHSFALASVPRQTGYVIMTNGEGGVKAISSLINADDAPLNRFVTGA